MNAVGFNVETVEYKNISFTVWDVGGQDKVGALSCSPFERSVMYLVVLSRFVHYGAITIKIRRV